MVQLVVSLSTVTVNMVALNTKWSNRTNKDYAETGIVTGLTAHTHLQGYL